MSGHDGASAVEGLAAVIDAKARLASLCREEEDLGYAALRAKVARQEQEAEVHRLWHALHELTEPA